MEILNNSHDTVEAIPCYPQINTYINGSEKETGHKNRSKVSPRCMHRSWRKGTSQAEAASNSEEINTTVLTILELCLAGGVS